MPLKRVTFSGRLGPKNDGSHPTGILLRGVLYMVLDIAIVLGVSIALFYFFVKTAVAPTLNDFHCGDKGIQNPFYPNTVGLKHLLAVSLGSPFLLIAFVEGLLFLSAEGNNKLAKYFTTTTHVYLKYVLLYALCTFVMEFLKCYFGRLRPHFVAVCQPDWEIMDCRTDPNAVIPGDQVVCKNPDFHRVRTSRTSFPSGHTAAAFFVWIFCCFYLIRISNATRISSIFLVRNIVLPVITLWTAVTAISRVTDYWHHPTDVLGGIVLAVICAVPFYYSSWKTPEKVFEAREISPQRVKFE